MIWSNCGKRPCAVLAAATVVIWTSARAAAAGEEVRGTAAETAAGRTLEEWTKDVDSPNRIVRLRAVKMLGTFGLDAVPALAATLPHPDDAVKYWAASALGDVGPDAEPAAPALRKMIGHDRPALEISAAYALCRIGQLEEGMPTLLAALEDPEKATACCAADFLARIGPPARDALPALRIAVKHTDTHIARAASEALRRIDSEKEPAHGQ